MSLIHLALAFVIRHPAVTAAIIGPRTMEHLESQLGAADVVLSDDVLDAIDTIVAPGTNLAAADAGWSHLGSPTPASGGARHPRPALQRGRRHGSVTSAVVTPDQCQSTPTPIGGSTRSATEQAAKRFAEWRLDGSRPRMSGTWHPDPQGRRARCSGEERRGLARQAAAPLWTSQSGRAATSPRSTQPRSRCSAVMPWAPRRRAQPASCVSTMNTGATARRAPPSSECCRAPGERPSCPCCRPR